MKVFQGIARNLFFTASDERAIPLAELVLILSEPDWFLDSEGNLQKRDVAQTFRFVATAKQLRFIAEELQVYAEELESCVPTQEESEAIAEALEGLVTEEAV